MDTETQINTKQPLKKRSRAKTPGPNLPLTQTVPESKKEDKKEGLAQSQKNREAGSELDRQSSVKQKSVRSYRSCEKSSFLANDYKYPQPKAKERNYSAQWVAPLLQDIGLEQLKTPVQNESMLDPRSKPVLPFYNTLKGLILPYSLSSKAPFQSNDKFAFVRIEEVNDRVLYAHSEGQLYNSFKRQARKIYSQELARKVLKNNGDNQFGQNFMRKSHLVGGLFETMQVLCSHLKYSAVESTKTAKRHAIMEPILNPQHRNVLDEKEGDLFIDEAELDHILTDLKLPQFKKALKENIKYRTYSTQCFKDIEDKVKQVDRKGDFHAYEQAIQDVLKKHSDQLASPSLHDFETDKVFEVTKGAQFCKYPVYSQAYEPVTSINAFEGTTSAENFVIQHTNASQMFQQQLLCNPIGMYYNADRVLVSLTGGPQMDAKFFIGHTNKFVGSYVGANEQERRDNDYKIKSLKATVSLNAIVLISNKLIKNNLQSINRSVSMQTKKGIQNNNTLLDLWRQQETLIVESLNQFFQAAASKVSKTKHEYFRECNPIIFTQFKIDKKYQGFFTNIFYDFSNSSGGRLYFRKLDKRALFEQKDMETARKQFTNPTLVNVARLADLRCGEVLVDKINYRRENDFQTLDQFFAKNLVEKDEKLNSKPWYLLYRLYKQTHLHNATIQAESVDLSYIGIYIQVQKTSLQPHELIAQHMLMNVASSDFGQHCGIENKQTAKLVQWQYQSFLMTSEVEIGKLQTESPRRVLKSHLNGFVGWKKESDTVSQNTLDRFLAAIPKADLSKLKQFFDSVVDILNQDKDMNFSQTVFTKAYEHLLAHEKPEIRKVTMVVLNYFEKDRGLTVSDAHFKKLQTTLTVLTYWRLIPFHFLTEKFNHEHKHRGMMTSQFIISVPPEEFDKYLKQIQYPMSRDKASVRFDESLISLSKQTKLEEEFNVLLTRFLVWFIEMTCQADYDQTTEIISHTNTRLNFAVLIGCSFYNSESDCTLVKEDLAALISQGQYKGPLPGAAKEACFEYCGYALKQRLVDCAQKEDISEREWPKKLQEFYRSRQELSKKFNESNLNGFGQMEREDAAAQDRKKRATKAMIKIEELDKKLLQQVQQTPANMPSVANKIYLNYVQESQNEFKFCFGQATANDFNSYSGPRNFLCKREKKIDQSESDEN